MNAIAPSITQPDGPSEDRYTVAATPTTDFPISYQFDDVLDLVVVVGGVRLDNTAYALVSVTEVDGITTSATLRLDTAVTNTEVVIQRNTRLQQGVEFPTSGKFLVRMLNAEIARIWQAIQDAWRRNSGSAITIPYSEASNTMLPAAAARANKVPKFDAQGNVTVSEYGIDEAMTKADEAAASAAASAAQAEAAAATAVPAAQRAQDWAEKLVDPVDGTGYSAKYWAQQAQSIATGNLTILQLTDVPDGYGTANQALVVNGARTAMVFASVLLSTGGELTGDLAISKNTPALNLRNTAGTGRQVNGQTATGTMRWRLILGSSATETGANVGSDFALNRFDDAGNSLGNALRINRADGAATIAGASLLIDGADTASAAACTIDGTLRVTGAETISGSLSVGADVLVSGSLDVEGELTVNDSLIVGAQSGGDAVAYLDKAAGGKASSIVGRVGVTLRWQIQPGNGNPETGQNLGSDFGIYRYDDLGNYLGAPLLIQRDSGRATFAAPLTTPLLLGPGGGDARLHVGGGAELNFTWQQAVLGMAVGLNGSTIGYFPRCDNIVAMRSEDQGGWGLAVYQTDGNRHFVRYDAFSALQQPAAAKAGAPAPMSIEDEIAALKARVAALEKQS